MHIRWQEAFSFTYGGRPSAELLGSWSKAASDPVREPGKELHRTAYKDPATGLEVVCEATLFADYPAVEWVLRFRNTGSEDSPILEDILALDLPAAVPEGDVTLHTANGSSCGPNDFIPNHRGVDPGADITFAPVGGRSSNGVLPFFNLQWPGGGVVAAIGWSGQWQMRLQRDSGDVVTLRGGQQTTHFKLHPGEEIRSPRVLLVEWAGDDPIIGCNILRRLTLAHFAPRIEGELALPPVAALTWFTFNSGNDVTEWNQIEAMRSMVPLGVEAYWMDAGWFEGGWPSGAGSWIPKKDAFPNGLKPLADEAHRLGMKFVVWFEPERVHVTSRIAKEHPEWVMTTDRGDDFYRENGILNLGNPDAHRWLTDYLSECISEWGIDIYRNDFNIDPLPIWQDADAEDRAGMSEIRYIEGLYAMWDELTARHPGLTIDNCASGGRRIDLETNSRSYPLWQSDTQCCGRARPVLDQAQNAGLSLYVPLHSGGVWDFDPYVFSSMATTGASICKDTRIAELDTQQAKRMIEEVKTLRPLYQGDYYPLTGINTDETHWCAWQFDRSDIGAGIVMLFRRESSPYPQIEVKLRGLDPCASYNVRFVDSGKEQVLTGGQLARLNVRIDRAPSRMLLTYSKAPPEQASLECS